MHCLLRDATEQKRRESRLALQLTVAQIVSENAATEVSAMRILEEFCASQGWDVAVHWLVNPKERQLESHGFVGFAGRACREPDPGEHGADVAERR